MAQGYFLSIPLLVLVIHTTQSEFRVNVLPFYLLFDTRWRWCSSRQSLRGIPHGEFFFFENFFPLVSFEGRPSGTSIYKKVDGQKLLVLIEAANLNSRSCRKFNESKEVVDDLLTKIKFILK